MSTHAARSLVRAALAVGLLSAAGSAAAGSLALTPVRAELTPTQRTASFDLSNPTDEPMVVQIEPRRWTQVDGQDQTAPDDALIVAPGVVKLAPHARQVVRVALRTPQSGAVEGSYRVSFRELQPPPAPDSVGVKTLVEMTVPVFVAAGDKSSQASGTLSCRALPGGDVELTRVAPTHYRFSRLRVLDASGRERAARSGLVYVLANATRRVAVSSTLTWQPGDSVAFDDAGENPQTCTPTRS